MLPTLLTEIKARGYRIVHVVPSGADSDAGPRRQRAAAAAVRSRRPPLQA